MFNLYRYNCCLNFINIEIDANEFSFKKIIIIKIMLNV